MSETQDSAGAQAAAKAADKSVANPKTIRARVLVDCDHGQVNDVVELPADAAEFAEKAGLVDTTKAAVTYALTLDQNRK